MRIIVKYSHIEVHDYDIGTSPALERYFIAWKPMGESEHLAIWYDKDTRILYLPRGIDIWFVERCLNLEAEIDDECQPFKRVEPVKLLYMPRNDVQKESLRFLVGKGEYSNIRNKSQLLLNLNTGKGKTYACVATFAYLNIRTIVIASINDWLNQWKERICEYTNLKGSNVCILSADMMSRIVKRGVYPDAYRDHKFWLVSHATIRSFTKTHGWAKLDDFFRIAGIGIKIFDEAHRDFKSTYMTDFYTNTWKTFYVTATAIKSNAEENRIYSKYFANVPAITLFDPEEDTHADYFALLYSSDPAPSIISRCRNAYGMDRVFYMKYAIENENFKKASVILINKAINRMKEYGDKAQCLIYIGINDAINTFMDYIVDYVPEMRGQMGVYTSQSTDTEKLMAKQKRFIFSTTKSAAECLDLHDLRVVILLNEPFKSELLARQTLGRLRNDGTLYIELVDFGMKQCMKFYRAKKPVFDTYAKTSTFKTIHDGDELDMWFNKAYANLNRPVITYYNTERPMPKPDTVTPVIPFSIAPFMLS